MCVGHGFKIVSRFVGTFIVYLMSDPKNLILDIGTYSENELLYGRVGKPLRDVRR